MDNAGPISLISDIVDVNEYTKKSLLTVCKDRHLSK